MKKLITISSALLLLCYGQNGFSSSIESIPKKENPSFNNQVLTDNIKKNNALKTVHDLKNQSKNSRKNVSSFVSSAMLFYQIKGLCFLGY